MIVFTATGSMAVLDGIAAPDLARQFDVPAMVSTPDKFLDEKIVAESTEGVRIAAHITLMSRPSTPTPARRWRAVAMPSR